MGKCFCSTHHSVWHYLVLFLATRRLPLFVLPPIKVDCILNRRRHSRTLKTNFFKSIKMSSHKDFGQTQNKPHVFWQNVNSVCTWLYVMHFRNNSYNK